MGLRESLRDFFTMQEASAAAAQSTGQVLEQQKAQENEQLRKQLASRIPGAIQSGDLSQIAGEAYGLGDPTILREALGQQTALAKAAAKPGDAPLKGESLRAAFPGMSPDWYKAAETAGTRDQQRQEFAAVGAATGREESLRDRDADRRLRQETQYENTRDKFSKSLDSKLKKYKEQDEAFEKLQELDPMTNIGFWPQVSTIIKKVGMDAGALSDQDMQRFITATGQRTATQALQYLGAIDPSRTNVDPQTIKAVTDVISKMKDFSEKKLKEEAQKELSRQSLVRGDRVPDDLYKEEALRFSLVANKKDGKWKFGEELSEKPLAANVETRGAGAELKGLLDKLPPARQEQAKAAIARMQQKGEPISEAFLNTLRQMAGGQ